MGLTGALLAWCWNHQDAQQKKKQTYLAIFPAIFTHQKAEAKREKQVEEGKQHSVSPQSTQLPHLPRPGALICLNCHVVMGEYPECNAI